MAEQTYLLSPTFKLAQADPKKKSGPTSLEYVNPQGRPSKSKLHSHSQGFFFFFHSTSLLKGFKKTK